MAKICETKRDVTDRAEFFNFSFRNDFFYSFFHFFEIYNGADF